jgi:hypothetical protein
MTDLNKVELFFESIQINDAVIEILFSKLAKLVNVYSFKFRFSTLANITDEVFVKIAKFLK